MRMLWQAVVLLLAVGTIVTTVISFVSPAYGDLSIGTHRSGNAIVVDSVDQQAVRAGVRVGDRLTVGEGFSNHIRFTDPRTGDRVVLVRPNGSRITLQTGPGSASLPLVLVADLAKIAFVLVAGIVAWRLPEDGAARALATFLICFGAGMRAGNAFWGPVLLRFVDYVTNEPFFIVGAGALAVFACRFPTPVEGGWRRAFSRAIVPLVVLGCALSATRIVPAVLYGEDFQQRALLTAQLLLMATLLGGAIAAMIAAYRASAGVQKARILWVLRTFAVGFSGFVPTVALVAFGYLGQWVTLFNFTVVIIPVGLAYVILRHKVLDIGFVVNRAVVYSAVSIIIVGSFMVFEWLLGNVVQAQSRTSTLLQLGAALVLGMSTRFIHARVDRFVDDLFFRERHLAEAAIRRFAHEAPLVTDADDLVKKTVEVAQKNARLVAAAYYTRLNGVFVASNTSFATAPDISENDYAVLAMRTWHRPVDLLAQQTSVPGDVAFPMMVRGELAGFLACGERTTHEALAPDERDALGQLARDSGIALDSLRVKVLLGRAGLVAPS